MTLQTAPPAIVVVVEARQTVGNALSHVVRVQRAIEGAVGERVTVVSEFTS